MRVEPQLREARAAQTMRNEGSNNNWNNNNKSSNNTEAK